MTKIPFLILIFACSDSLDDCWPVARHPVLAESLAACEDRSYRIVAETPVDAPMTLYRCERSGDALIAGCGTGV